MTNNQCQCGHSQEDHIYHEGACRPGFVCHCVKFVPEVTLTSYEKERAAFEDYWLCQGKGSMSNRDMDLIWAGWKTRAGL